MTLEQMAADLAAVIVARRDVRAHPSQSALRRALRGGMEAAGKPVLVVSGIRFSLGKGPIWGYEGLPLCARVEDVAMWRATEPKKKGRAKPRPVVKMPD
jgi:hypothetical protein